MDYYTTYTDINGTLGEDPIFFMNHGFYPVHETALSFTKIQQNQASLYATMLDNIETYNKKVLDVSCGRGGGARLMKEMYNFFSVDGVDYNDNLINFCTKNHAGISFSVADANKLPYENNVFDIVINVEASHTYKDITQFYEEAYRVLKPGGVLIAADVDETTDCIYNLETIFDVKEFNDITDAVALSCKQDINYIPHYDINQKAKDFLLNIATIKYEKYSTRESTFKMFRAFKK